MKSVVVILICLWVAPIFASVDAYVGPGAAKLFISKASKIGQEVYLIKLEGIDSTWDNKVIKTTREFNKSGSRYGFEYELELSSGTQVQRYTVLIESGQALKNGSMVKQVDVYTPASNKPIRVLYDDQLTKASQSIDLGAEHQSKPFKPLVY